MVESLLPAEKLFICGKIDAIVSDFLSSGRKHCFAWGIMAWLQHMCKATSQSWCWCPSEEQSKLNSCALFSRIFKKNAYTVFTKSLSVYCRSTKSYQIWCKPSKNSTFWKPEMFCLISFGGFWLMVIIQSINATIYFALLLYFLSQETLLYI